MRSSEGRAGSRARGGVGMFAQSVFDGVGFTLLNRGGGGGVSCLFGRLLD